MKTYAVVFTFVPNAMERRKPYREAHLKHFNKLKDAGNIIMAGPWADAYDGGLILFRAESQMEVEKIIQEDPYYQANLWPEIHIREWNVILSSQTAFLEAIARPNPL